MHASNALATILRMLAAGVTHSRATDAEYSQGNSFDHQARQRHPRPVKWSYSLCVCWHQTDATQLFEERHGPVEQIQPPCTLS